MLSLVNTWGACPPDGYRYVFPDDGYLVHAWTYVDWVEFARQHLQTNGKAIPPELEADMQHQLCLSLPPGFCMYDDPNRPRPSTTLTWADVQGGVKTFAKWIAGGMKYVEQKEAERRALICSRCYLNVHVQGCTACKAAVKEITRFQRTKSDASLRACAVCKCLLQAKVHFPISTLDTSDEKVQSMYPEFCWLKKTGENYRVNP